MMIGMNNIGLLAKKWPTCRLILVEAFCGTYVRVFWNPLEKGRLRFFTAASMSENGRNQFEAVWGGIVLVNGYLQANQNETSMHKIAKTGLDLQFVCQNSPLFRRVNEYQKKNNKIVIFSLG
jgi:hypothetical protein